MKQDIRTKLIVFMPAILLVLYAVLIIMNFKEYKEIYITSIIALIINIVLFKKAHTHLLTKEGKEEYKKAYGLKSYIEDYSLMKERELDSNILWDDYLTYAIAFGISNKVTDRFGEGYMKANVTLQNIDKFLRF